MKFRKFIELAGYFDDREDHPNRGAGRWKDLPGISMDMGAEGVQGIVKEVTPEKDRVVVIVRGEEGPTELHIKKSRYRKEQDEAPKVGDTVLAYINRDKSIRSYDVIHRGM